MYFLYLNGQAWVLLFYGVAYWLVSRFVLLVLAPHHIIPILDRFFDLLFLCSSKLELHYCVVLKFTLSYQIELALGFGKDDEWSNIVFALDQSLESFDNEVWVFSKFDEEILVGFDSFELPIVALEYEIEVNFSVTC